MQSCVNRCLLVLCGVLLAMVLASGVGFYFAATWLLQSDPVERADAIIVLAGDMRRSLHAADLFRQGYAPQVLVSRPARDAKEKVLDRMAVPFPRAEDINVEVLRRGGVPLDRIEVFGEASVSTFDEALVLNKRFSGRTPRLLVVTSPYHVRRARLILTRVLPAATLTVVATPYEEFPERWWTSQEAARNLLLELAKLAFYSLGGRFTGPAP